MLTSLAEAGVTLDRSVYTPARVATLLEISAGAFSDS